jgi:hypothetical protein
VTEDLTNKVVAWATEIATYAAQLPSRQAREDYLRERRGELAAGAQAEGATPQCTEFGPVQGSVECEAVCHRSSQRVEG